MIARFWNNELRFTLLYRSIWEIDILFMLSFSFYILGYDFVIPLTLRLSLVSPSTIIITLIGIIVRIFAFFYKIKFKIFKQFSYGACLMVLLSGQLNLPL